MIILWRDYKIKIKMIV